MHVKWATAVEHIRAPNNGEMRQMNLPLSKPDISPQALYLLSWPIYRLSSQGRRSWQKLSQQHRDKTKQAQGQND